MQLRRALDRADGAQARERRPPASSPGGGRHSGPQGRGGKGPNRRDGSLLGAYRSRQDGARQRSAGQFRSAGLRPASRGSAKPAPTTPPPANLTAANPRIANRAESRRRLGAPASSPGGGLRPASRGSAKPAAMTPSPASVSATPPFSCGRGERADPIMWVSPGGGRHRYPKRSETASCWTPGCFRRKNPVPRPRRAVVRPA